MENNHLKVILLKMCSLVGANFDEIDFKSKDWYWLYEWDTSTEDEFKKWLYKYVKNDNSARKELFKYNINNKDYVTRWVNDFVGNYGWKTKTN